jgi:glutamate 5-kinase
MLEKLQNKLEKGKARVLVKVGSNAVTLQEGGVDSQKLELLSKCLAELWHKGNEVLLISSGAIQTGRNFIKTNEAKISGLQALSAVGQPFLLHQYSIEFQKHSIIASQILLTHDDFKNKTRYFNAKETLEVLLKSRSLPIINENDTVSFDEITMGDNDHLCAGCAQMLKPDIVFFLTESDGLFSKHPDSPESIHYRQVSFEDISHPRTAFMREINFGPSSSAGKGGMLSKVKAIKEILVGDIPVFMGTFNSDRPLERLIALQGGTCFTPKENHKVKENKKERKSNWLRAALKKGVEIQIDQGAADALVRNKSLLPVGITRVRGRIYRGDCVAITCKGNLLAIGISEYSSGEIEKIMGMESVAIKSILGHCIAKNVVHKNNLILA